MAMLSGEERLCQSLRTCMRDLVSPKKTLLRCVCVCTLVC